jgi:hypothetical protein
MSELLRKKRAGEKRLAKQQKQAARAAAKRAAKLSAIAPALKAEAQSGFETAVLRR